MTVLNMNILLQNLDLPQVLGVGSQAIARDVNQLRAGYDQIRRRHQLVARQFWDRAPGLR